MPVSGRITINGEPFPNVTILTQPVGESENPGPGSYGLTDEDGRFSLELQIDEGNAGAVPGKCVITLVQKGHSDDPTSDEISREDVRTKIPWDYRNNQVTFDIPEDGTDAMDFDLDTKKRRK